MSRPRRHGRRCATVALLVSVTVTPLVGLRPEIASAAPRAHAPAPVPTGPHHRHALQTGNPATPVRVSSLRSRATAVTAAL
jgi:hypothetical protein